MDCPHGGGIYRRRGRPGRRPAPAGVTPGLPAAPYGRLADPGFRRLHAEPGSRVSTDVVPVVREGIVEQAGRLGVTPLRLPGLPAARTSGARSARAPWRSP